jgi:hypothetical protein
LSEKGEIERDGAVAQKNSGRGMYQKGDATLGIWLIDYKEYDESFSVSRKNWAKLQSDAFRSQQRMPAFKLVLGTKDNPRDKLRLWVINDDMFHQMYEAWEEKYGDQG